MSKIHKDSIQIGKHWNSDRGFNEDRPATIPYHVGDVIWKMNYGGS